MILTIELKPELAVRLQQEAAKTGLNPNLLVERTLEEKFSSPLNGGAINGSSESELLQQINQGFPAETWQRYHELIAKRQAEILTPEEHADLICLSDQIEKANAHRIGHLINLAQLRQVSLETVMEQIGIQAPRYV
ncbi:MAG: hypothetical protein ABI977_18260 [Acidobacteriota bacterium]